MRERNLFCGIICSILLIGSIQSASAETGKPVLRNIPISEMKISANSEHIGAEIEKAFDLNKDTFWDSAWAEGDIGLNEKPVIVNIKFDKPKNLGKIVYAPRQDNNTNGMILEYDINGIDEKGNYINLIENGKWDNNAKDKTALFRSNSNLKEINLEIKKGSFGNTTSETSATAAEFSIYEYKYEMGISPNSLAIGEGENKKLSIINTKESVTWSSTDNNVAKVDEYGNVSGIKEGVATIVASSESGKQAFCSVSVSAKKVPEIEGMHIVFEDNFNGNSLDKSKWNNWCVDLKENDLFRYGNSPDIVVHPNNVKVENGTLKLIGSKEETFFDGIKSNYRSGMVQTRDKFESKYGYIEVMVKIPDTAGSNPAIWLMPQADEKNGGWIWGDEKNFGAEIDILERPHPDGDSQYAGLKNKYWITMHYDNYTYDPHEKYHVQPTINNPYQWHKFAMNWTQDKIEFILDDNVVAVQDKNVPNMNEIFILSYGLGGWIGQIDDANMPSEMEVDYVRWYQSNND